MPLNRSRSPAPPQATVVRTVEMHTGGEPLRIVVSGLPPIAGATLLEKRRFCLEKLDRFRRLLMSEPRGHRDMYGAYLVAPDHPQAHMAALFLHNEGYSTMCGHAMLALTRYLVDEGVVSRAADSAETPVNIQCPCGLVRTWLSADNSVRFLSVPAFVQQWDRRLTLPNGTDCRYDISYGGAFYAFVRCADVGLTADSRAAQYLHLATIFRSHVANAGEAVQHPEQPDLGFLYGVIFVDLPSPLSATGSPPPTTLRQVTVFADGQIDRSPCGSGTTACCALLQAAGQLPPGDSCVFRGITGSEFGARVVQQLEYHDHAAAVVEVSGRAFYTGKAEFTAESEDPQAEGFLVR